MALKSKGFPRSLHDLYDRLGVVEGKTNAITAVTTPDGSDPATTQTLANALKVKLNALIAALNA